MVQTQHAAVTYIFISEELLYAKKEVSGLFTEEKTSK